MKKNLIAIAILLSVSAFEAKSQSCDIQIQILEDKYMFGIATETEFDSKLKKPKVDFTSQVMKVRLPMEGKTYLLEVQNEACQAYCTRSKRIRQLHSGDEKLVINLLKSRREDIQKQIADCSDI